HRLQHLTLSPQLLALQESGVRLLDFGLAELFWVPSGHRPADLNTRYAAPELFENRISPHCDQYSLALIYQELLTRLHPFRNLNAREMAAVKLRGQPDLSGLPARERDVLLRALSTDPGQRFGSHRELLDALMRSGSAAPEDDSRVTRVPAGRPTQS